MESLAALREKKGYTAEQMALYLGISMDEYRELERNPERMTVEQARVACRIIGCDIELLFGKAVS